MRCLDPIWPALVICLAAGPVTAHTGEAAGAGFVTGFLHPLTGPDHVIAMVAVGLWGTFLRAPAMFVLPVAFPLVMAVGGAMGAAGIDIPFIETGIALSGLVIGAAVAFKAHPPLWVAAVIVAVFAVFHGHAHGAEMPSAASPAGYTIGFVTATGLLHLFGIALGLLAKAKAGTVFIQTLGGLIALAGAGFLVGVL